MATTPSTCRCPASGSPTGFTARHTTGQRAAGVRGEEDLVLHARVGRPSAPYAAACGIACEAGLPEGCDHRLQFADRLTRSSRAHRYWMPVARCGYDHVKRPRPNRSSASSARYTLSGLDCVSDRIAAASPFLTAQRSITSQKASIHFPSMRSAIMRGGMLLEHALRLGRVDVLSAGDDHVLFAVVNEEMAVAIARANVARAVGRMQARTCNAPTNISGSCQWTSSTKLATRFAGDEPRGSCRRWCASAGCPPMAGCQAVRE